MSFKIREIHWEVLVSFMERNPDFAAGRFVGPQGKETARKLWNQLAQKLNAMGFGEKTAEKWQKTWTDLKYNIKKKGARAEADRLKTGGGPPESEPFNNFERRILGLLGGRSFYAGLGVSETGQQSQGSSSNVSSSLSSLTPSCVNDISKPTPSVSGEESFQEPTCSKYLKPTLSIPCKETMQEPRQEPTCSKYLVENSTLNSNINTPRIKSKRSNKDEKDHSYSYTPKKQKKETMDDAYGKTIDLLENINGSLVDIKDILQSGLTKIATAISKQSPD